MIRVIAGLIGIIIGTLMVWRPLYFFEFIGRQAWMEKVFGPGGHVLGYKVFGIIIILVSMLIISGLIEGTLLFLLSPILPN